MGDKATSAVAVDAPLLILRIRVNTTAKLLAERLQARRMIRGWGDSNVWYELSLITPSEDPLGHTALLYTGHTDHNGTTYPAAIWYALDDLRLSPARVLLTISARLHSQTVLDYVYDVLKMLRARYHALSVELAETNSFVERNEALPLDYGFEITPVISLGEQPIEPESITPTHEVPPAGAAQLAPWSVPLKDRPIEPTNLVLANLERLRREDLADWERLSGATQNELSEPFTGSWAAAVSELAIDGMGTAEEDPPAAAVDDRARIITQARELRLKPGMTDRELAYSRLRVLWPCEDITISEIARIVGYQPRWVKQARIDIGLPERRPGRKPGK